MIKGPLKPWLWACMSIIMRVHVLYTLYNVMLSACCVLTACTLYILCSLLCATFTPVYPTVVSCTHHVVHVPLFYVHLSQSLYSPTAPCRTSIMWFSDKRLHKFVHVHVFILYNIHISLHIFPCVVPLLNTYVTGIAIGIACYY